jgi:hypothetical protein
MQELCHGMAWPIGTHKCPIILCGCHITRFAKPGKGLKRISRRAHRTALLDPERRRHTAQGHNRHGAHVASGTETKRNPQNPNQGRVLCLRRTIAPGEVLLAHVDGATEMKPITKSRFCSAAATTESV